MADLGRSYAGILGFIAFFTEMLRGMLQTAGFESTLKHASLALFGFAILGYLAGVIADSIVSDSVRASIAAEIAAQQKANTPGKT